MMTTQELMDFQRNFRELGIDRTVNNYSPQGMKQGYSPAAPTEEPRQFQGGLPDAEQMSYGSPGIDRARQVRTGNMMMDLAPAVQQIPQSRDRDNGDFVERDRLREQTRENLEARQSFSAIPSGKTPRTPEEMATEAKMMADADRAAYELDQKARQQAEARQAVSFQYRGG
jgi:hypothetical protein